MKKYIELIFAKNFARNYEKKKYLEHQMLGRRVICLSKPAYYIVDCWILELVDESQPQFYFFENILNPLWSAR